MKIFNIVVFFLSIWFVLPFVLVIDLYPFFRYGMFAEPIHYTTQSEQFVILYENSEQNKHILKAEYVCLNEGHLNYLVRHYFYKQKSTQLLQNLHQIYGKDKNIKSWTLLRIVINSSKEALRQDSIVVSHLKLNQ